MDYFFQPTCLYFLRAVNGVLRRIGGFSKNPLKGKVNKLLKYKRRHDGEGREYTVRTSGGFFSFKNTLTFLSFCSLKC